MAGRIERRTAQLENLKAEAVAPHMEKRHAKDVDRLEREISADKQFLAGSQMRGTMPFMVLQVVHYFVISYLYSGVVFARLPFTPVAPFSLMTHRGLAGDDYREAGFLLFFTLGNVAIKPIITKLLGDGKPKAAGGGFMDLSKMMADATAKSAADD